MGLQEMFGLGGKVALVTGASGGMGRALAVGLAEAGAGVVVHGRRERELGETEEAVRGVGGRVWKVVGDVGTVGESRRVVGEAAGLAGGLDILVNCAGMNRRKWIAEVPGEDFDAIVGANLKGPYFLSQAAHREMKKRGGGKIVNIGSVTSLWGLGMVSVYGATKGAIAQLTKAQAVEWAGDNVQVNCLCPGFILTPLTEKAVWGDEGRARWLRERIPAGRAGRAEEMVGMCVLMASSAGDYMTGQVVAMDGGFLAGGTWEKPPAGMCEGGNP